MFDFQIRVYYEDTDFGGVVYYANYLKFIERARTEWLRAKGIDQIKLKQDLGLGFVVRRVEADYLGPAFFDDLLNVKTILLEQRRSALILEQDVLRDTTRLFHAVVTLVAVDQNIRPVRIPKIVEALGS